MQAPRYEIHTDFSQDEADDFSGRSSVRTAQLDAELDAIAASINPLVTNLGFIQRDDGLLADRVVGVNALSSSVLALLGSSGFTISNPLGWLTTTTYAARTIVIQGTGTYVSAVAHTSGVFATDFAAGKWALIFDTTNYAASAITLTATGDVAATNVQAGIAELASEKSRKDANLSDLANAATARDNLSVPSRAGMQNSEHNSCVASGTIDALLGAFSPAITALTNNMLLIVEVLGANSTTTPTFKADALTAKTIVRMDGSAVYPGDIAGAGAKAILCFDASLDKWLLVNPAYSGPNPGTAALVLTSNGPGAQPSFQAIPADANRIGRMEVWPGHTIPTNALDCDSTAYSRTTYAALAAKLMKSAVITMTIAAPCVVTWDGHGLLNNMPLKATTTGALPTGLIAGRTYWIINKAADTFQLAATPGGAAIASSGVQSGVHTGIHAPWGDGDGSTTFNVPGMVDRVPLGYGAATTAESFEPADVNTGTDVITIPNNVAKWITGMLVTFSTTGGAPAGLVNGNPYYVVRTGQATIKLASSLANAQNGTVIDITTQGTGVHTITHTRPVRGLGELGGEDIHAMDSTELLAHLHPNGFTGGVSGGAGGSGVMQAGANPNSGSIGGNAAMNNMQPFAATRWIIYFS
jgi:hypothetical protein